MRLRILITAVLFSCTISSTVFANSDTSATQVRVAVIAPLYLDSAFSGTYYRLPKTSIPKFFLPGLEFYNGVMMAVDSLKKENTDLEIWIFDSQKKNQTIQSLCNEMKGLNLSMIIASFSSSTEQKAVSDFSVQNSIPVISSTYPNNTNLANNPFFAMINPTWKTHVDAIAKYVAQNGTGKNILFITRNGIMEDKINQELKSNGSKTSLPVYKTITVKDNFSDSDIVSYLDSTKDNMIICGSLNETFGKNLVKSLNDAGKNFTIEAIGMPTWNGMSGTVGKASQNISLTITTPYNYQRTNSRIAALAKNYKSKYNAPPSDMVFKGYESVYHFTKLFIANPGNFINNISGSGFSVTNVFNFQPVRNTSSSIIPDYLENKKLYFIKYVNGQMQSVE